MLKYTFSFVKPNFIFIFFVRIAEIAIFAIDFP